MNQKLNGLVIEKKMCGCKRKIIISRSDFKLDICFRFVINENKSDNVLGVCGPTIIRMRSKLIQLPF